MSNIFGKTMKIIDTIRYTTPSQGRRTIMLNIWGSRGVVDIKDAEPRNVNYLENVNYPRNVNLQNVYDDN